MSLAAARPSHNGSRTLKPGPAVQISDRKHLYIIDDDGSVRSALSRGLEHLGYDVQPFEGAHAFFEKAVLFRPAVLLIDMQMPGVNGVQMQASLQEKGWCVPVIFISGESTVQQGITAMKQGALDFLVKPFDLDRLERVIENAIELDTRQMQALSRQQECRQMLKGLTPRELDAYHCLAKGHAYSEMMQALGISLPTAKQYRTAVMRKLKFATLAELIAFDKELNGTEPELGEFPKPG
jgi:two-component system response regulator TtrR